MVAFEPDNAALRGIMNPKWPPTTSDAFDIGGSIVKNPFQSEQFITSDDTFKDCLALGKHHIHQFYITFIYFLTRFYFGCLYEKNCIHCDYPAWGQMFVFDCH